MLDPLDFENRPLIDRLGRKRRLSFFVLLLEQFSLCTWRVFFWAVLFCALWMIQIPAIFGTYGSLITLIIFLTGLGYFYKKDIRHFRWPGIKEIDRRLEKSSHLKHRPISGLEDRLSNPGKAATRELWEERTKHMVRGLKQLKAPGMMAFMAKNDPYAMRLAIMLFFIVGLAVSGPRWDERIWNGLTPITLGEGIKPAEGISLWITPPDYTGLDQIVLRGSDKSDDILEIPAGSKIKLRVTGGLGQPYLMLGKDSLPLKHLGDDSYGLEIEVPEGEHLAIQQLYFTRAAWTYKRIPDSPPQIIAAQDHEVLEYGQIRLPLTVADDYSVKDLTMTMRLDEVVEQSPIGDPVYETRSIMSPPKTEFEIQPVYDLTAHSWAGLPVIIDIQISDHIGQIDRLEPIKMQLPERIFQHPVAKKLIEMRKQLAWEPQGAARNVSLKLETLLRYPKAFGGDLVVFLAIRTAASRLHYSRSDDAEKTKQTARAVIALLWDTALRIEDGNLTLASRNLRDAQQALENALKSPNTTNEEISKLMNELRSAMAEYLMELQKEMQKRMAEGQQMPMMPPEMLSNIIDPEALSSFLDQMESQMMSGDKNAAQEMLAQLQRMLDMMDPSMSQPLPLDMQTMMDGINEIQELIDRQQELLDQTRGQMEVAGALEKQQQSYGDTLTPDMSLFEKWGMDWNEVPPPPRQKDINKKPITINTQANKIEQEALRYILGQLMLEAGEALDDIPEGMALAEQEMRGSSAALGGNDPGGSVPHQEAAIKYLKESMNQLSQQLMARLQQVTGMSLSGGMSLDPLGRPYGGDGDRPGLFPGSRVKIPDAGERKRVEKILNLLRRRSGELNRPDHELEYYRRLLRQF